MILPINPINEKERQEAVNKYKNLNFLSDESYSNITELVASICEVPVALISIIDEDKNYFKSNFGLNFTENLRTISFCGHAINDTEDITIITDSRIDKRFCDNPLVLSGNAIFYAGVPLVTDNGFKIGMLCVFDNKPKILNEVQKSALFTLAKQVMILFEKEYQNNMLDNLQEKLKVKNLNLERFAAVVSHDLKSPLANIISLTDLIVEQNADLLNEESKMYLTYLKSSSYSLRNYIDGILNFYSSDCLLDVKKEEFQLHYLLDEIKKVLSLQENVVIESNFKQKEIFSNKAAIHQILLNLISNSVKHNTEKDLLIEVVFDQDDTHYYFNVIDNGKGIKEENFKRIFDLFEIVHDSDTAEEKGSGIGLATVKKVVENLGGKISVTSVYGQGAQFSFSVLK